MQGFNMGRYVPPDLEGTTSFNSASGKGHALGARASKLKSDGILTVRFELPFAIWCSNCQPEQIIGQGVRFNAEKKKVGNYYSTPIWGFRFKHTTCGRWIEVRTDPKNTAYVVTDGARRRDNGEDRLAEGEIIIGATEEEKTRLEKEGAFGTLEKKLEDSNAAKGLEGRINKLVEWGDRDWEDPYEQNRRLRAKFREGRKIRKENEEKTEGLKEKLSLGIDLVTEREEDAIRAKMVEFGEGTNQSHRTTGEMFAMGNVDIPTVKSSKKVSSEDLSVKKVRLKEELRGNTRSKMDPFLEDQKVWQPAIKRRKVGGEDNTSKTVSHSASLVNYDSE